MKNILVVSVGARTGTAMAEEINSIFKDYAHTSCCLCHQLPKKTACSDIVIFTSEYCEAFCSRYKQPSVTYLPARRVINYTNIGEIIKLKKGTQALLVNDCAETAAETIDQLLEIGLSDVDYFPCYPGCEAYPEVSVAITPGEAAYIPPHMKKVIKKVIDIGVRTLDIQTIYDLMILLKAEHLFNHSLVARYLKEIVSISKSFSASQTKAEQSEKTLETIFNSVESGIAYVDSNHLIISTNTIFEDIFGKSREALAGQDFEKLLPYGDLRLREDTFVVPINAKTVLLDVKEIQTESSLAFLVTADYGDKISKMNQRIKKESTQRPLQKLYTFDDYLTRNEECRSMLSLAKKFTRTDGTILIQGESGTGKEILSQSIHNGSPRRKHPFIPVNITAFTPSLIESELFGYEDGAFTGAKKGGKAGIFELADRGTVFIDEIGDASMDFQVKLLRTLERKAIRRVGGVEEIPVDVRIIVATNKNLPDLIGRNLFREDLFFRLNILPLCTIPLRERKEDIIPLLQHFLAPHFEPKVSKLLLSREIVDFFTTYSWSGNVRELMNVAEYLGLTYEGGEPTLDVLPAYIRTAHTAGAHTQARPERRILLGEQEFAVLDKINQCGRRGAGRNKLTQLLTDDGFDIGPGKIRAILKRLEDKGLIEQDAGGCVATDNGKKVLR